MDLYETVDRLGLSNAIVFVRDGTSELRLMEAGDLTRNGLTRDGDVLYARDQEPEENRRLLAAFPEREFWVYEREPDERHGRIVPYRF